MEQALKKQSLLNDKSIIINGPFMWLCSKCLRCDCFNHILFNGPSNVDWSFNNFHRHIFYMAVFQLSRKSLNLFSQLIRPCNFYRAFFICGAWSFFRGACIFLLVQGSQNFHQHIRVRRSLYPFTQIGILMYVYICLIYIVRPCKKLIKNTFDGAKNFTKNFFKWT